MLVDGIGRVLPHAISSPSVQIAEPVHNTPAELCERWATAIHSELLQRARAQAETRPGVRCVAELIILRRGGCNPSAMICASEDFRHALKQPYQLYHLISAEEQVRFRCVHSSFPLRLTRQRSTKRLARCRQEP